jgi:CRISPR system Cascade subunit CasA
MSFDLRTASWIPWRRRDGTVMWGPIAMLMDHVAGNQSDAANPVVAVATPRADFDAALQEFLIGMLTVSMAPRDETAWRERWDNPPSSAELQAALDALPNAFDLDAEDGPRFLQDYSAADLAGQDVLPIDRLAIDSPGEQSAKLGKTLFVKPARFVCLGRPAAAMALITMQTYAPAGGQGNRTSMRGGGPLTTIADPRMASNGVAADEQPLWEMLWLNVETQDAWSERGKAGPGSADARTFPWLAPTRVSDSKRPPVTIGDAHPLQAYFGMPRRIRLEFGDSGRCGLTSREEQRTVIGFRMKNFGVEYAKWKHPLSPHYESKGEWLPVHPQPDGLSWRDWPQLSLRESIPGRESAAAIVTAAGRVRSLRRGEVRLHAFGYDMDNMKARGWISAVQPLFALQTDDADSQKWLAMLSRELVEATGVAASAMSMAIKAALFERVEDAAGDYVVPKQQLWAETESHFFAAVRAAVERGLDLGSVSDERRRFHAPLRDVVLTLFDHAVPMSSLPVTALQRGVRARHNLTGTFAGYGKLGQKLYEALNLPLPDTGTKPGKKSTSRRGVPK